MVYLAANIAKYKENDLSGVGGESMRHLPKYKNQVDPTKSHENVYWRQDGNDDNFKRAVNRDIMNRWEKDRGIRKDAVKMIGLVVSSSPEMYDGLNEQEKREKAIKFTEDCMEYISQRFGEDNLFSVALHMDETTPHIHFGIVPMLDGGLNAKQLFNRKALKDLHDGVGKDGFITFLNKKGWDFEVEPKDKSAKHIDPDKYLAAKKELDAINDEISKQKRVLGGMKKTADTLYEDNSKKGHSEGYSHGFAIGQRKADEKLNERTRELNEREQSLNEREVVLEDIAYTNAMARLKDEEQRLNDEKERIRQRELDLQQNMQKHAVFLERLHTVLDKIKLPDAYKNGIRKFVVDGVTGLNFKNTTKAVPVETVIKQIDEEKAKDAVKSIVREEHADDGPEL